jgi:hypothetical protein
MNLKLTASFAFAIAAGALAGLAGSATAAKPAGDEIVFDNPSGVLRTVSRTGSPADTSSPFFQDLGTNGRTCVSCHQPGQAWTITPDGVQQRFAASGGLDPIFSTNDGSNCEGADISTLAKRRSAFSMLLNKGLIRVGMPVPANAEFTIVDVDDPYHCGTPFNEASLYRRPLPTSNLGFLSTVMWDGRETVAGQSIRQNLRNQAMDATTGHAQGAVPTAAQLNAIVDFEFALFSAQTNDHGVGSLTAQGAQGGPRSLSAQPFCIGINDPLNLLPAVPDACATPSGGLNPNVFTLFNDWETAGSDKRRAIARGQTIFNTRTFVIDNVAGLNGPGDPVAGPITSGTCTLCHDTPNAGNHSVSMALNIGLTDASVRTPDLPLYTLENNTTHQTVQTTDPGRAMVTGKWRDIGKFKGPVLRALAARAPYFHNGAAATLEDAVDFYNRRFNLQLSAREKADLVAFLRAL